MTPEDIIGENAEIVTGPLLGQQGVIIGLENNRLILRTNFGRLRVALTDVEVLGCIYHPPENKPLHYNPYEDKT